MFASGVNYTLIRNANIEATVSATGGGEGVGHI